MTTRKPTTKHRGRNEGSITQRKDGRWQGYIPLDDGTRRYKYGTTRQEVASWLNKSLYEKKQNTLLEPSHITVGEYLLQWYEAKQLELKPSSKPYYRRAITMYLLPKLGKIKLNKLSTHQIQMCYTDLFEGKKMVGGQKKPLSAETIETTIHNAVLFPALERAVEMRFIAHNPAKHVVLPRKVEKDRPPFTKEQVHVFLAAIMEHPFECLFTLAFYTGMRVGELLALHWSDINFEQSTIYIHRNVYYRDVDGKGHAFYEAEPKSKSGIRTIHLVEQAEPILRHYRAKQHERRLLMGQTWQGLDLVFPNETGGYRQHPLVWKHFKDVLEDAALPDIRFHDLRKTTCTHLMRLGINPKVIQVIMGHSNLATTLKYYTYVDHEDKRNAMDEFAKKFGKVAEG